MNKIADMRGKYGMAFRGKVHPVKGKRDGPFSRVGERNVQFFRQLLVFGRKRLGFLYHFGSFDPLPGDQDRRCDQQERIGGLRALDRGQELPHLSGGLRRGKALQDIIGPEHHRNQIQRLLGEQLLNEYRVRGDVGCRQPVDAVIKDRIGFAGQAARPADAAGVAPAPDRERIVTEGIRITDTGNTHGYLSFRAGRCRAAAGHRLYHSTCGLECNQKEEKAGC